MVRKILKWSELPRIHFANENERWCERKNHYPNSSPLYHVNKKCESYVDICLHNYIQTTYFLYFGIRPVDDLDERLRSV